ncbi:MAG: DUF3108 domain-containing protein [Acidobacteria bacterium]|nr:DUF3108 domain-containing protein [Acidobacteriota bacterium]
MLGTAQPARLVAMMMLLILTSPGGLGQSGDGVARGFHRTETLSYTIEWRLVTAGAAKLRLSPSGTPEYPSLHSELDLESAGLVSKLYRVQDKYFGNYDTGFCAISAQISANEGRRRRETKIDFDRQHNKAAYLERDLVKNAVVRASEIDTPHCVHDVVGGLLALRTMRIDVGRSAEMPLSDGKKAANVRVEAQEREDLKINGTVYKTVRYEAFLFNGVIYPRSARLFIWLTDDARKLPVQIRVRMNFPIGTVTLSLDKIEQS